jgi:uncharacterized protein YsxB (DUF464 family)
MIHVTVRRRTSDGAIGSFRIEGHAQFDEPGKDIVCAAVSAISVGTVNSVEALLGVLLLHEMEEGLLDVSVPEHIDVEQAGKVQLLLESMVVMLQTIEESYGAYISVQQTTEGG